MKTRPIQEDYTHFCLDCGYILNEIKANRCPSCRRPFHRSMRSSVGVTPSPRLLPRFKRYASLLTCAFTGFMVSLVLYVGVVKLAYLPISESWNPLLAAVLGFITLLPACLFVGSWVMGFLIQPYITLKPWLGIVLSPGMLLLGICLYFWLPVRSLTFTGLMTGLALAWLYISILGVMAGKMYRLRLIADTVLELENEQATSQVTIEEDVTLKFADEADANEPAYTEPFVSSDESVLLRRAA